MGRSGPINTPPTTNTLQFTIYISGVHSSRNERPDVDTGRRACLD